MADLAIGICVSGSGTNMEAILAACARDDFPARVALVLCNVAGAAAIPKAEAAGVRVEVVPHRDYAKREEFDARLVELLQDVGAELVCLAGFMRLVTPTLLDAFPGRVINIHPSLLPAFPGIESQRQAFEHGVRFSGATIHFVDSGKDTGPILLQSVVPVLPDDDRDTLQQRILATEHRLYPAAIRLIAEGRVRIDGRHVRIDGASTPSSDTALFNPPLDD